MKRSLLVGFLISFLFCLSCYAETTKVVFEVSGSVVNCEPRVGTELNVVSKLPVAQAGKGTPSPQNVRNFVETKEVHLTHTSGENTTIYTIELGDGIYSGIVDWQTGRVTLTHKIFSLPIAEMNNTDQFYPGWKGVEGFDECFYSSAYHGKTYFYTDNEQFFLNLGTQFGINYDAQIIILNENHYGKTLQEWKEQYPELVCQLAAPLLEPQYLYVAPLDNPVLALEGVNRFIVNVGDVTISGESTESVENVVATKNAESFNPYEWGLPVLELYGNVDGMSKDNAIQLSYVYEDLRGECSVKWQGGSSLS